MKHLTGKEEHCLSVTVAFHHVAAYPHRIVTVERADLQKAQKAMLGVTALFPVPLILKRPDSTHSTIQQWYPYCGPSALRWHLSKTSIALMTESLFAS